MMMGRLSENWNSERETYDEGGTLLLVCIGEDEHGIEDLDAGVGVYIDGFFVWSAERGL